MNRVRPYLPLISFVLPTLVIGYGIVIPRSCIAGVNELSVGFGTTVLGAVLTYIAGLRVARSSESCSKPPLKVRIARAINQQAAAPSGWFGRLLGRIWRRDHDALNAEVLDALDVQPGHVVLEVGSGPGEALAGAAERAMGGRVVGVDVSELMGTIARRRNRGAIARGAVDVRVGDIGSVPLEPASFDRIFSVHCLYFWPDLDAVLAKLALALRTGGTLGLAFRPDGDDIPARFPTYRFPRVGQVEAILEAHGLAVQRTEQAASDSAVMIVTATRT